MPRIVLQEGVSVHSGTGGCRRSRRRIGFTGPIFWAVASRTSRCRNINTRRIRSSRKSSGCSTRCRCPGCTGLVNPPAASSACYSRRCIGADREPRIVQHTIAHSGSHQAHLRAGSRRRRRSDVGPWNRRVVPPDPWLPAGLGTRERCATGLGRARNGPNAAHRRGRDAPLFPGC